MTPALILALNPSIDAEWRAADVRWEEKNNVSSERRWAGGKGINVARWLQHLGGKPALVLPLGGHTGRELAGYLKQEKLSATVVPLREPTRVNVIVTTTAGRQMRFNPLGPKLSAGEWARMVKTVRRRLARAGLPVLSGSLPRGVPVSAYAQLIRLAHRLGVKTLLDCDGPALAAAVPSRPFLVKPNEHELAQWWGQTATSEAQVLQAARALSRRTRGWVLVSRGAKPAVLVNAGAGIEHFTRPPRARVRNTVGAGDALLAAVARQVQLGAPPETWLHRGVTVGAMATRCEAGLVAGRR